LHVITNLRGGENKDSTKQPKLTHLLQRKQGKSYLEYQMKR